jgi:ATPase subunit of ABC transporter with duplicated ATPase domains
MSFLSAHTKRKHVFFLSRLHGAWCSQGTAPTLTSRNCARTSPVFAEESEHFNSESEAITPVLCNFNRRKTLEYVCGTGCGVGADLQGTPGHALSGGQRSRVALSAVNNLCLRFSRMILSDEHLFSQVSYARPHVLVMDEPTNNLDLEAVVSINEA